MEVSKLLGEVLLSFYNFNGTINHKMLNEKYLIIACLVLFCQWVARMGYQARQSINRISKSCKA